MTILSGETTPSDNVSIEEAYLELSDEAKESMIDVCEALIDDEHPPQGFLFEFDDEWKPYSKEVADELLSSGMIYLHESSYDGHWFINLKRDVIEVVSEHESLEIDNVEF